MNPALLSLIFIAAGIIIFAIGIFYFGVVKGGIFSVAGLFTLPFLLVGLYLVLVGFGFLPMPGLQSVTP